MNCPYENIGCVYLDTAGMFKYKECYECEHYHYGVRATGATPVLGKIMDGLRKLFKKKKYVPTDDDIFMMGL